MGGPRVGGRLVGLCIVGMSYIGLTLLGRPAGLMPSKVLSINGRLRDLLQSISSINRKCVGLWQSKEP